MLRQQQAALLPTPSRFCASFADRSVRRNRQIDPLIILSSTLSRNLPRFRQSPFRRYPVKRGVYISARSSKRFECSTVSDRGIHRATPQFSRIRSQPDSSSPHRRERSTRVSRTRNYFPEIHAAERSFPRASVGQRRARARAREREREREGGEGALAPSSPSLLVPFSCFFVRRTPSAVIRAIIQLARRI